MDEKTLDSLTDEPFEPEASPADSPWVVSRVPVTFPTGVEIEYHASNTETGEYVRTTDLDAVHKLIKGG